MIQRVTWYVTHICNLACTYCATVKPEQSTPDVDTAQALAIAQSICDLKPETVILTGGEPTVRQDLQNIIDVFTRNQQQFVLITNGTMPQRVWRLSGLQNVSCSVDVIANTATRRESENDQQWKSVTGVAMLREAKRHGLHATASIVAHRQNAEHIPALIEMLSRDGIVSFVCVLHGDHRDSNTEWRFRVKDNTLRLGHWQALDLSHKLTELYDKGALILNDPAYLHGIALFGADLNWHCTEAADLVVDSDGSIMTCSDWWGSECKALSLPDNFDEQRWRSAFRNDNAKCPGCYWQCTFQAEAGASSFVPASQL